MCNKFILFIVSGILPFMLLAKTYYFEAPQNGYASNLADAIESAVEGDEFILNTSAGNYIFEKPVNISQPIVIKADVDIDKPMLTTNQGESIFYLSGNGSLDLISLSLKAYYSSSSCILIQSNSEVLKTYKLKARNTVFTTHNYIAIVANSFTMADEILFENCFFHNTKCLSFSSVFNDNEASFSSLEMQSCVFFNCEEGVFYLPVNENVNYGEILINHCVFDSIPQNDTSFILYLAGSENITIKNSVFSHSGNQNPYYLNRNAKVDYCNFYRCNDFGNQTGANCYYYNPNYDEQFFVTNESLLGKADDGLNLGPLPWVFVDEDQDTVDIGDNPHGYDNQGVWVKPIPDSMGRWESYFLKYQPNGKLRYRKQVLGDRIPDFSFVGYQMGNKSIPDLEVIATIYPIQGDATDYIQNIIDSVAENVTLDADGFRGAILLKAGVYELSSTIYLKDNGIVLRGEGNTEDKTVLLATSITNGSKLINIGNTNRDLTKLETSKQNIAVPYIPVGSNYVLLNKGHSFQVNDQVCIYQQFNQQWVSDLKMDEIPDDGDVNQWNPADYNYTFERTVQHIGSGSSMDTIFFYNPIVMALDAKYNSERKIYKCAFTSRVQNCGVENMLLKSVYSNDTDENHAWDALYFNRAEHCWATQVISKYFAYSCANVSSYARHITVSHCSSLSPKSLITGGRRYSFNCDGQTSLFAYCNASEGRHDFVTGSRVCGPNVFSFCTAKNAKNDIGPHHRWSVGTLYDNVVSDYQMNIRDRSSYGTGHGWAGANQVLWNCSAATGICQNPWVSAKNYNIGFTGKYINDDTFGDRPRGEWDGNNLPGLNPVSLYCAQRIDNNLKIDFGLESTEGLFISDSVYQIKFNQPFDKNSAIDLMNYSASGTAGIVGNPINISLIDSQTLALHYSGFGILDFNKTIQIKVSNVKALNQENLLGWNRCFIIVPDQRPVVDIQYQEITNAEDALAELASNKDGKLYLIISHKKPEDEQHIEQLVADGFGKSVIAFKDSLAQISTFNLAPGTYFAYAVDNDGRLSNRAQYGVLVSNAIAFKTDAKKPIQMYWYNNELHINYLKANESRSTLQVFDIFGRILYSDIIEYSNTVISASFSSALLMVVIKDKNEIYTQKIVKAF